MSEYNINQESEYNEAGSGQELPQEPFQEPPQESPQEPFREPFQELPQENNTKKIKTYSDTWRYFNTQDPRYPAKVVCQKCNQTYSKTTGISTLKEHLKKHME